jgi:hypothetical protein
VPALSALSVPIEPPETTDTLKIHQDDFLDSRDLLAGTVLASQMGAQEMRKAMVFRKKYLKFHCHLMGLKGDLGLGRSASSFHADEGDSHMKI